MTASVITKDFVHCFNVRTSSAMKVAKMIPTPNEWTKIIVKRPCGRKTLSCVIWDGEKYFRAK